MFALIILAQFPVLFFFYELQQCFDLFRVREGNNEGGLEYVLLETSLICEA